MLELVRLILSIADFRRDALARALRAGAEYMKITIGQMFQPIRVAVGHGKTADALCETLTVLGRDTCLKRIDQAIAAKRGPVGWSSTES